MSTTAITPTKSQALASLGNLKAALGTVVSTMPQQSGDPILRLIKDGSWVYGQENIEVEQNSVWAINPLQIRHGFQAWSEKGHPAGANKLLGERLVSVFEPKPARSDLANVGAEWKEVFTFMLCCTTGEDQGQQVVYKPSSVGGMDAASAIMAAILKQLSKDEANPVPLVKLETTSYTHKTWGLTYKPDVQIVGWSSLDGEGAAAEAEADAPAEAEEPFPGDTPVQQAAAPQEAAAGPQPVRRRRQG